MREVRVERLLSDAAMLTTGKAIEEPSGEKRQRDKDHDQLDDEVDITIHVRSSLSLRHRSVHLRCWRFS